MEAVDLKSQEVNLQTFNFTVTRVIMTFEKSFEEVATVIESLVGDGEYRIFQDLVDARAPFEQVKNVVESMQGSSGFMKFAMFDMGALMSLMGKSKNARLYLIGNPLIANQMIEHNPAVGLYVPPRVLVYDDYEGKTHVTYDKPSSMLSQFHNEFISKVGQMLDQKFEEMAMKAAQ